MDKDLKIIKRKVKYPRIELKTGILTLILPKDRKISPAQFIKRHKSWIESKRRLIEELKQEYKNKKLIQRSEKRLFFLVNELIPLIERKLQIKPKKISFRLMKTKWGSCSKGKTISFNVLMKYLPKHLIRYIIFHEMAHLLVPKHNKNFWYFIQKEFPQYKEYERTLLGYWFLINSEAI